MLWALFSIQRHLPIRLKFPLNNSLRVKFMYIFNGIGLDNYDRSSSRIEILDLTSKSSNNVIGVFSFYRFNKNENGISWGFTMGFFND